MSLATPTSPTVLARAFRLPKAGNSADEYEDAHATGPDGAAELDVFRCAVADGATETSFAGRWARLLAEGYCAGRFADAPLAKALAPLQAAWHTEIDGLALPWYAEEKARQGAFAALAGLTLIGKDGASGGEWSALAAGDSCLFQVRGEELLVAFPLTASSAFTNQPALLATESARNMVFSGDSDAAMPALQRAASDWQPGDAFYLLTDALACWFLAAHERGDRPWVALDAFGWAGAAADRAFAGWIAARRAAGDLRNDDVTLLRVVVGEVPSASEAAERADQ
ncbi:MAG: hypothetical protein ACTHMU_00365 [Thermomicrobiales bacterium]